MEVKSTFDVVKFRFMNVTMKKYFYAPVTTVIVMLALALLTTGPSVSAQETSGAPAQVYTLKNFPMVMYATPATDEAFGAVRDMGIDYVHLYGLTKGPLDDAAFARIQHYLDLAQKYHLKVMLDMDGARRVQGNQLDEMRTVVQRYKNHPALGIWYLFDEPDNKKLKAKDLAPFYDMIKAESPNIPIAVCHAWTTHWYAFNDVQDILMQDIYPVSGLPFPEAKLNNQTRFTNGAMNQAKGRPVIPALQFFNWRSMAKPEDKEYRKYPVEKLRYPNTQEMRYLCYSTIAQGVQGLAFYSYMRGVMIDPQWPTKVAAPVLREVREFTGLINPVTNIEHLPTGEATDVLLSRWKGQNGTYVILVNASSEARSITTPIDLPAGTKLQKWGQTRDVTPTMKDGNITIDQVQPWEVFVWCVGK
jgi:hypothetical protein